MSYKLVALLLDYRLGEGDKGYDLIQTAEIQGIISRECWKHTSRHDLEELLHLCSIALLKMFYDIKIDPDMNDGRIISYVNKVLPCRLIDQMEPFNDNVYLEDIKPGTNTPLKDTLISQAPEPEEALMNMEMNQSLYAAIRTLTSNQQNIIYKYYFEEQTQKDIAEELNITQQAVSRVIDRALAMLKNTLGPSYPL